MMEVIVLFHNLQVFGDLVIQATHLRLRSLGAETYFLGTANGSVELYHDNVKQFETTSTGASIRPDEDDVGLVVGRAHIGHTVHNDWCFCSLR